MDFPTKVTFIQMTPFELKKLIHEEISSAMKDITFKKIEEETEEKLNESYIGAKEIAELIGVKTRTARNYMKIGKIESKMLGGCYKSKRTDVIKYVNKYKLY